MNHLGVTGIVLAGGKSTRMGADKALLIWQGKPLIQHTVDILRQVCEYVVISANHNHYAFTGCDTWPDEYAQQAPMVGIYSCLKRSKHAWNIVLSCDMPLVDPGLLAALLAKRRNYDIILPVHDDDRMEPLCAVYNKRLVAKFEEPIINHQFGLQHFILHSHHCSVSIPAQYGDIPNRFLNVNTSVDFNLLS